MDFYIPGSGFTSKMKELIGKIIDSPEFKKQLTLEVQKEVQMQQNKYRGNMLSYNSLSKNKINLNSKSAVSGTDVYGKMIIGQTHVGSNRDVYQRMKNDINYSNGLAQGAKTNNGSRTIV